MTTAAYRSALRSAHSLAVVFSASKIRAPISHQLRFKSLRLPNRPMSHSAVSEPTNLVVEEAEKSGDVLVQYVVLRRDLIDSWPLGSVVTQGCHASVSAIWMSKDDPLTAEYCSPSNIDSMHKVTLEVKGETQILNLSEKLKAGSIDHKLWIEQPENIPTCLATKPCHKSTVASYFKKLKLCK